FKLMDDQYGVLTFCRIYSGKLEKGLALLNSTRDRSERVGRMVLMHANMREEISEAYAGDIVALVGLKDTRTGDTLCDPAKPLFPGRDRSRVRSDHHQGHGRATSRHQGRYPEAHSPRRGQCRGAAGRLSRDDHPRCDG